MGRDFQPKFRQAAKLARKLGRKAPGRRVLVVCEGEKTETQYLEEIRKVQRLPPRNVFVTHEGVTHPRGIVDQAKNLFDVGGNDFGPKAFEIVAAVFDRDDHDTYHDALDQMARVDAMRLKNDEGRRVRFLSIPSVPCFELWLLLHFQDQPSPLHRDDALARLKVGLPEYRKSMYGTFQATRGRLPDALTRAYALGKSFDARGDGPYTAMHLLVHLLLDQEFPLPEYPAPVIGDIARISNVPSLTIATGFAFMGHPHEPAWCTQPSADPAALLRIRWGHFRPNLATWRDSRRCIAPQTELMTIHKG